MKKHCLWCNLVLTQKKNEGAQPFSRRKYCGRECRTKYHNWQTKIKDYAEKGQK